MHIHNRSFVACTGFKVQAVAKKIIEVVVGVDMKALAAHVVPLSVGGSRFLQNILQSKRVLGFTVCVMSSLTTSCCVSPAF